VSEFSIRRAEDAERPKVVGLLEQMFRGCVEERYKWLYQGNPHGKAVTWLAFDQTGEAVGVTSVFPRKIWVGDRKTVGSIGGDCYIVPKSRRKGLATLLHEATRKGLAGAGIDFMYGPPLARNLGALLKAGSKAVGGLRRYLRPLTADAVSDIAQRQKKPLLEKSARFLGPPIRLFDALTGVSARGLRCEVVERFDDRFEALAHVHHPHIISPVRDPAFLEWRYLQPGVSGLSPLAILRRDELVGFAAIEVREDTAIVVDFFPMKPSAEAGIMSLLLGFARERGCAFLAHYGTRAVASQRMLKMFGFVGREERVFQVLAPDGADPLLFDANAWRFTEGDKDASSSFTDEPI
jgi:hypothetical protein